MRMYQYEKRLDCHALGQEIKRRRKAKDWAQEHLAQLVDLTPHSIMYIENRGQHTGLNTFYKLVTLFDISVDEFFYPDKPGGGSERRKHIDRMLNEMDEKELISVMRRLDRLVADYPDSYRLLRQTDIDKTYSMPKSFVTYRKPRAVSNQQREQARQRMTKLNSAGN